MNERMSVGDAADYDKLKDPLLRNFEMTESKISSVVDCAVI